VIELQQTNQEIIRLSSQYFNKIEELESKFNQYKTNYISKPLYDQQNEEI
jgi:hypothetical protein